MIYLRRHIAAFPMFKDNRKRSFFYNSGRSYWDEGPGHRVLGIANMRFKTGLKR